MDIEKADGKMRISYIHDEFTEEKDSDNEKSVTKKRAGGVSPFHAYTGIWLLLI